MGKTGLQRWIVGFQMESPPGEARVQEDVACFAVEAAR